MVIEKKKRISGLPNVELSRLVVVYEKGEQGKQVMRKNLEEWKVSKDFAKGMKLFIKIHLSRACVANRRMMDG